MNSVETEVLSQIQKGLIQGCVCGSLNRKPAAFGLQTVHPAETKMTELSRFDIASTGKIFTASCAALLVCQGKLDPDAPFTEYMPDHVLGKDCKITIRNLATHSSGFTNDKPYSKDKYDDFYYEMMHMTPARERNSSFEYSCYNFILLGLILNRITGKDLDSLAKKMIWGPLDMNDTTWNEPGPGAREVEHYFPNRPAGEHNDPVCKMVNRPLGSGSCFSTCPDMLKFAREMVEQTHFPKEFYKLLTTPTFETLYTAGSLEPGNPARRSFGLDMCELKRPKTFSDKTVVHSGFTGQTIAVDPERGLAGVVLTSRTGDWELARQGRAHLIDLLCEED